MINIKLIINIIKNYYKIDYLAHFIVNSCLIQLLFTICHIFNIKPIYYIISILITLLIIFGKNFIWNKYINKGKFEWVDIIISCSGLVLVIIQWLLLLI